MEQFSPLRRILASYTDSTILVYQAYNHYIAEEAVRLGTFGSHFGMHRMTWIKPSFLWMMYRCGWSEKDSNQECVLAIDLSREGFDTILRNAVLSSFHEDVYGTQAQWQERRNAAQVICQWDPDRDPFGNPPPPQSHPARTAWGDGAALCAGLDLRYHGHHRTGESMETPARCRRSAASAGGA